MNIYTKVGDGGDTYLFGGRKVRKTHTRVEAYGDVDEINSLLGLAAALTKSAAVRSQLTRVQNMLFVLGADLATPRDATAPKTIQRITHAHVDELEKEIDRLWPLLPPLKNFILPGGSSAGAVIHVARTVARRAERNLSGLLKRQKEFLTAQIYLNRLSDYLFVLARFENKGARRPEVIWTE